jgi:hypothetical protein
MSDKEAAMRIEALRYASGLHPTVHDADALLAAAQKIYVWLTGQDAAPPKPTLAEAA